MNGPVQLPDVSELAPFPKCTRPHLQPAFDEYLGMTRCTFQDFGPLKLELGCGKHPKKEDGWLNIDRQDVGAEIVWDLLHFPWPIRSDSVVEVHSSHFMEHIPGPQRFDLMAEIWRICRHGAKVEHQYPDPHSDRALQDPTHAFPQIVDASWYYYSRKWLRSQDLDFGEYDYDCEFTVKEVRAVFDDYWNTKGDGAKMFALRSYNNVAIDRLAILEAVKEKTEEKEES